MELVSILITGATGFIGKNLLGRLSDGDYHVHGISKEGGNINNIVIDAVDLLDKAALDSYCKNKSFDAVIHLAAIIPSNFRDEIGRYSLVQNVQMTINMLEAYREQKGQVFIYASSSSIYGFPDDLPVTEKTPARPDNFYSIGKFFGEVICQQYQREYKLPVAILRISAPYGPGMRRETVVKKFIKNALLSDDITLYGTGRRSQDFIYIEDVVSAMIQAYQAGATGVFNVSTGTSTSMKELAEIVLQVLPHSTSKIVYAGIDDPQEDYHAAFSFENAKESFNYEPRFTLEEGIQKYAEAVRQELGL